MTTTIITAGRVFLDDHLERCAAHDGERTVLRETKREITVRFDDEGWADFVSDLKHYASDAGPDDPCARSYVRSARTTLRNLIAAGMVQP